MVLSSFWSDAWEGIKAFFKSIGDFFMQENEYGLSFLNRIIIAIVVLVLGVLLIKLIISLVKKGSGIKKGLSSDLSAKGFFIEAVKIALYFGLAFLIVAILGLDISGAVGILSAVTVALGLALQDIIGMFASGILIFNSKNFRTGDYIKVHNSIGVEEGKVHKISLLYTTLLNMEGQMIHIPNNNITKSNLTNFTTYPTRRGQIFVTLTPDSDSNDVLDSFLEFLNKNEKVLKDPASRTYINTFNNLGVEYVLRFYSANDDYWDTLFQLRKDLYPFIKEKGYKIATSTSIKVDEVGE